MEKSQQGAGGREYAATDEWKIYNFDQQADRGFSPRAENNNAPGYIKG